MAVNIHPSSVVHASVEIAEGCQIGPFCVIEEGVKLGENTHLHSHVILRKGTTIGNENIIYPGVVIGAEPQDLKFNGETSYVNIGDSNIFREYVTIHRGSGEETATSIGNHCYLFAYAHVGHNCHLHNHVVMTNYAGLSGHVHVQDNVTMSGLSGAHQYVTISRAAMIGGMTKLSRDVPPFMLVEGHDQRVCDINAVGLRRLGIDRETRAVLHKACKIMFHSGNSLRNAIARIESELPLLPEVQELLTYAHNLYQGKNGRSRQP